MVVRLRLVDRRLLVWVPVWLLAPARLRLAAAAVLLPRRRRSVAGLRATPWRCTRLATLMRLVDMRLPDIRLPDMRLPEARLREPARDILEALEPERPRRARLWPAWLVFMVDSWPLCWAPAEPVPMSEAVERREFDGDEDSIVLCL